MNIRREFGKVGATALVLELAHVGGERGLMVLQSDHEIGLLRADWGHNRSACRPAWTRPRSRSADDYNTLASIP